MKLADFGLSKSKKRLKGKHKFKRIGTPHWMAPEIMREEEYDEYSDVYSYGMILWYASIGHSIEIIGNWL